MGGGSSKKQDTEAGGSVATPGLAEQKNLSNSLPEEPPDFLVCPITQELMTDPVFTADGHTFERSAITAWLSNNDTNPMTGDNMKNKHLISLNRCQGGLWLGDYDHQDAYMYSRLQGMGQ